jgi:hypothetical protein
LPALICILQTDLKNRIQREAFHMQPRRKYSIESYQIKK